MKKTAKLILGTLFGLSFAYAVLLLLQNWTFIGIDGAIYGEKIKGRKTTFEYDPERDFHGDGYSLKIESADKKAFSGFLGAVKKQKYPSRHYHAGNFEIRKWKQTPVATSDSLAVWFASTPDTFWYDDSTKRQSGKEFDEILPRLREIREKLQKPGGYYALFFRDHPHRLYGVDLFYVIPEEGSIVTINRQ